MIFALVLALASDDLSASRFFPLVAGDRWVYEDTLAPGSTFETLVKPEVKPSAEQMKELARLKAEGKDPELGGEPPEQYFPVEMRQDGKLRQVVCYRERENTLLQVGNGINKPIVPRPLMVVSKKPFQWDFYGDNVSEYLADAFHYVATSEFGPIATVLGKPHQTLVVNMTMTVGPKKEGVEIKQVWRYAADIGLYEVTEDGHVGKNPVHHVRRLVKFDAGGGT
ncbi:MAG: hypothetical protein ACYC96_00090 [Fimbriimonadaceae bacterium]